MNDIADIGVGGTPVDCDYPGFTMCDAWTGADFVKNGEKRAILMSGLKGTTNCYYSIIKFFLEPCKHWG